MKETSQIFTKISEAVEDVDLQMESVSATASLLSINSDMVLGSVSAVAEIANKFVTNTETISAVSQEQLESMEEVTASAEMLNEVVIELNKLIEKFKV